LAAIFLSGQPEGQNRMAERFHSSISALHRRWAKLENEQHELTIAIAEVGIGSADLASMRKRQAKLLLDIEALKAEIRRALPTTIEDIIALLDVVLDHETDLACDIANNGSIDYPITAQLLGGAARLVPGFEFNSLRRWLSPTQFEELFPRPKNVTEPVECFGFGEPDENSGKA
jgi:hypothetical protein